MVPKQQRLFTPPSSNKFDRVVNWCERDVKNFYELDSGRLDPYKGAGPYEVLENNRIDSNSLPKTGLPGVHGTIFNTTLD